MFRPYAGTVLPRSEPFHDSVTEVATAVDDGVFVVAVPSGDICVPWLRPGPEKLRRCWRGGGGGPDGRPRCRAPSVPVGGYEADPALSVPDPVAATARRLGVATDATALHLPLRALARPPDRDVRRWNGWTAARHKAARAELVAVGAVETGRRARADRTESIRDTGETMRAPHLPLESRKSATHPASPTSTGGVHGLFARAAED